MSIFPPKGNKTGFQESRFISSLMAYTCPLDIAVSLPTLFCRAAWSAPIPLPDPSGGPPVEDSRKSCWNESVRPSGLLFPASCSVGVAAPEAVLQCSSFCALGHTLTVQFFLSCTNVVSCCFNKVVKKQQDSSQVNQINMVCQAVGRGQGQSIWLFFFFFSFKQFHCGEISEE